MARQTREDHVDRLHSLSTDRFTEGDIIGEGHNARVYLVLDHELQRLVALKIAREDTIVEDFGAERLAELGLDTALHELIGDIDRGAQSEYTLLREARLAATVDHPGVLAVLEVGRFEDGRLVVVMPYLRGQRLPHTAPWRSILDCVLQLGDGLAALHAAGIVHRDLKPDNILHDDDGRPRIADLGLACRVDDEEAMIHIAGTPKWKAPEFLDRGGGGVQNDTFAFCMIAFEMFFGHPPFADEDAKLEGRISEIKRSDDMPTSVRDVLVKGLAPDPESRWSSLGELMDALRAAAQPKPQSPPVRAPSRRWLSAAAVAGLSAGLGLGTLITLPEAKANACDEVSRELADFWNDDVQAELRVVLGTRKAGDYLASFASRWVAVRAQECEAAKRHELSDRASLCTASVRSHLNATISTLRTPYQREGVDFEKVLAELPAPEYCLEHPEDAEYGSGGLFELRRLDIELAALLASNELELAEQRQADYMLAARELSATFDVARAIYWRAELHRLRGELDVAEDDFKRAYSEAQKLGAVEFEGEAMIKLAAVAGAKGELALLEERAFVARSVLERRRPVLVAELLQVHGLALVETDPAQRDRGLRLLRDAVEMREAQHSHYGGSREGVGEALEVLARGLIAAGQADEAVGVAEQSLAIHELEYGRMTERGHELRRLLFVAQVESKRFEDADRTEKMVLNKHAEERDWAAFVTESLGLSKVYLDAELPIHARDVLVQARQIAKEQGLDQLTRQVDAKLADLAISPDFSPPRPNR